MIIPRAGRQGAGDECCRARNETVQDHHTAHHRAAQYQTGQYANLKTTHFRQYVQRVSRRRFVDFQRLPYYRHLVRQFSGGTARTPARCVLWRPAGQRRDNRAGGGSIADAHIPRADQVSACISGFSSQVDTCDDTLLRLRPCHGRTPGNIARTPADADAPDLRGPGQFAGHTGVNNYPAYAETSGQYIDGSTFSQEVAYHLYSDFLGVTAYALGDDSMVPGCDDDDPAAHLRLVRAEDSGQLHGDIFKATETAPRFGEIVLPGTGPAHRSGICRTDFLQCLL